MSEPRPSPAAARELGETRALNLEQKERAHELFAHGLLLHERDANTAGARFRHEARVRSIMQRIQDPPVRSRTLALLRGRFGKLLGAAAAASLLLGGWLGWSAWRKWTPAYAEALLESAVRGHDQGVHVYEVKLTGLRTPMHWRAALGPDHRFHCLRLDTKRGLTQIGSDGKVLWVKSHTGHAFELALSSPKRLDVSVLEPVLSYFQLKPFLEALLEELEIEVVGRERTDQGVAVTLRGKYRYEAGRRRHGRIRRVFLGEAGSIEMTVLENSGRLLRLAMREEQPRARGSFELVRVPTPEDLAEAGIVFDPPRRRTSPQLKLWTWFGVVGREVFRRKGFKRPKRSRRWKRRRHR